MKDALGIEILNDKKYNTTKSIPKGISIDRKYMYLHCKNTKSVTHCKRKKNLKEGERREKKVRQGKKR